MQCDLLFPTTVFLDNYNIDNNSIIKFSQTLGNGVQKTNIGGYQSHDDFLNNYVCTELKTQINNSLILIQNSLQIKQKLFVDNSWININKKGDYNARHTHPRSFLSGVYYLQAEQGNGCIVFHSPISSKHMIEPDYEVLNNVTTNINKYEPVIGRVILFPSWIEHSVEANKLESKRISISFNVYYK